MVVRDNGTYSFQSPGCSFAHLEGSGVGPSYRLQLWWSYTQSRMENIGFIESWSRMLRAAWFTTFDLHCRVCNIQIWMTRSTSRFAPSAFSIYTSCSEGLKRAPLLIPCNTITIHPHPLNSSSAGLQSLMRKPFLSSTYCCFDAPFCTIWQFCTHLLFVSCNVCLNHCTVLLMQGATLFSLDQPVWQGYTNTSIQFFFVKKKN